MQLSMLCLGGGGGPRDEVGTSVWGILANFEKKCWPQGREV